VVGQTGRGWELVQSSPHEVLVCHSCLSHINGSVVRIPGCDPAFDIPRGISRIKPEELPTFQTNPPGPSWKLVLDEALESQTREAGTIRSELHSWLWQVQKHRTALWAPGLVLLSLNGSHSENHVGLWVLANQPIMKIYLDRFKGPTLSSPTMALPAKSLIQALSKFGKYLSFQPAWWTTPTVLRNAGVLLHWPLFSQLISPLLFLLFCLFNLDSMVCYCDTLLPSPQTLFLSVFSTKTARKNQPWITQRPPLPLLPWGDLKSW
jgi:hypothetical protein